MATAHSVWDVCSRIPADRPPGRWRSWQGINWQGPRRAQHSRWRDWENYDYYRTLSITIIRRNCVHLSSVADELTGGTSNSPLLLEVPALCMHGVDLCVCELVFYPQSDITEYWGENPKVLTVVYLPLCRSFNWHFNFKAQHLTAMQIIYLFWFFFFFLACEHSDVRETNFKLSELRRKNILWAKCWINWALGGT